MAWELIKIVFAGKTPLICHSERSVDMTDPAVRELKKLTATKKKTDAMYDQIARAEWEIGIYFDAKIGPYIPCANMRKSIVEGARKSKLGATVGASTIANNDHAPLEYKGPRSLGDLWADKSFRDIRSVVIGGKRVMRCRPRFNSWSATLEMLFDTDVMERQQLLDAAAVAGNLVGLGELRPGKGYAFGRYSVTESK